MNLLQDDIKKIFWRFLLPSLGSAMVMSIYTLTDAIVIGQGVGADALAALSLTTPLLCILMATGILFGVGGSVHRNISVGAGNQRGGDMYFTISLGMISIVTICLWIIYGIWIPDIIKFMGANDVLYPYVMDYMKYILYFFPVTTLSNFFAILTRSDNDPGRAMAGVLLGGAANIGLDILFVMVFHYGIGGAALASVIGMCVQVFVCLSHFISKKSGIHLVKPSGIGKKVVGVLCGGFSGFINELANGVIVFLFNMQVLQYCGNSALSVYSVISNCVILFNSLFTGVAQAVLPIISMNYGAKQMKRIKKTAQMGYLCIGALGTLFSLSGILFPHVICGIFMKETMELYKIADVAVRCYFITFLPMGINVLTSYYLQSILRTKESVLLSLLRNVVLSSIMIIVVPMAFGKKYIWGIMPVVEGIVLIYGVILLIKKKENNV